MKAVGHLHSIETRYPREKTMRVQDARGKATTEHLNDDTRADAVDSERRTIMGLAAAFQFGVLGRRVHYR